MTTSDQPVLSYAVPATEKPIEPLTPWTVLRRAVLWTVLVWICATPSFMWAAREYDQVAMVVGVFLFAGVYTGCSCTYFFRRLHGRPFIRPTMYIGYGCRLGLSILFPLGMAADFLPGLLSIGFVEELWGTAHDFVGTLLTTMVQGAILNALVFIFMGLVYGIFRLANRGRDAIVREIPGSATHG